MGELVKMKIYAFKDQEFSVDAGASFTLQVNPSRIKYKKEITATSKGPIGGQYRAPKYASHKPITFSFDTMLDATGAIPSSKNIVQQVEDLEKVVYNINGAIHRPNYLKISWGSFVFNGVLDSIDYEYTLFAPSGLPVRVKVSFTLTGYMDKQQAARKENKQSPDLSRTIILKAGESIPSWCNEIYGDPSYCSEVARINGLAGFRNVQPGTRLLFPPLMKNARITD